MKKRSKRYQELLKKYDRNQLYDVAEAVNIVKSLATAKYNETVDLTVDLNVDPKKANEQVRGSVVLPNGTGKTVRVLVFASGDKAKEALDAGADYAGLEEYIDKIQKGWIEFDAVIATPDTMRFIGKLGKVLGPRGMMPNPKVGTVTADVKDAVGKMKSGQVEYKCDKFGIIRLIVGKADFPADKLKENTDFVLKAIIKAKPNHIGSRQLYTKNILMSTTHSPSVKLDINKVWADLT